MRSARRHHRSPLRSEQGAIFVQIALVMVALMAFNVFVVDYGVMWVARGQAQSAADAGALAGATARSYDHMITAGAANTAAQNVANANLIWQAAGTSVATSTCPGGVTGTCVKVNVFRNGSSGSTALPMFFGPLLGVTSQGVQASATAMVGIANTTRCLKPWAMPDKWQEILPPANTFRRWVASGASTTVMSPGDNYTPPDSTQSNTTRYSIDYGARVNFVNFDATHEFSSQITPGFMLPLLLPGGKTHMQNMMECNGQPIYVGQKLTIDVGVLKGAGNIAESAALANYASDANADWAAEGTTGYVIKSCAPGCAAVSPRLWAVALYDPSDFDRRRAQTAPGAWDDCPDAPKPCVTVANIAGFFIDYLDPAATNGRHGHWVRYPGTLTTGQPTIIEDGSWLVEPRLIR